jgi:hypothetical protein
MDMLSGHFYTFPFCSELVGTQVYSKGVLMMVYNTRNYWVFGRCPLFAFLKNTRECNILENGFHGLGLLNKISTSFTIVTSIYIARQQAGNEYAGNNTRISVSWQRLCQHVHARWCNATMEEAVFSMRSAPHNNMGAVFFVRGPAKDL